MEFSRQSVPALTRILDQNVQALNSFRVDVVTNRRMNNFLKPPHFRLPFLIFTLTLVRAIFFEASQIYGLSVQSNRLNFWHPT